MRPRKNFNIVYPRLESMWGSAKPFPNFQRNRIITELGSIAKQADLAPNPSISQASIDGIHMLVEELDLSDALPVFAYYFEQMTEATFREHRVASDKETQALLAQSDEELKKIASGELVKSGYEIAGIFAHRLALEMSTFKREGILDVKDQKTLISLTNWRYMEKFLPMVIRTDYYKLVFRDKEEEEEEEGEEGEEVTRSRPVGVWYEYDRHKVPHLMISMKHEFEWTEDLLIVEIKMIASSLLSRLRAADEIHMLMPVMIFSFGPRHGRIIQAFHDGVGLIIRKSKLIDLLDTSSRPFDIFARFAASKPVGTTHHLPTIYRSQTSKPHQTPGLNFNAGPNENPKMDVFGDYSQLDPMCTTEYEAACKAEKDAKSMSQTDAADVVMGNTEESAQNSENIGGNAGGNGENYRA